MKTRSPLVLLLVLGLELQAREVGVTIWISGGMQGLVMGSRECPGWLSVSRQLAMEAPGDCWIHLGVPPLAETVDGLKMPDAVVPAEADFRLQGLEQLEARAAEMTLLNVANLPQFPEYRPAFAPVQIWRQADGVEVHVLGLLSDGAPLRIPPDRLRPLQVLPALATVRDYLTEHPIPDHALPVLVLPEEADPAAWSAWLPEFPLLIQPAGSQAKIVDVHNGRQLRVQPAQFGRSLIRVQLYWDTVTRSFRAPTAEAVWVQPPDLQGLPVPKAVRARLSPVEMERVRDWRTELMKHGQAALLPDGQSVRMVSQLPDAIRASAFPEDEAWIRLRVAAEIWQNWAADWQGDVIDQGRGRGEIEVLMTAQTAAGGGGTSLRIRRDLDQSALPLEWMPFTSRDLLLPLEDAIP